VRQTVSCKSCRNAHPEHTRDPVTHLLSEDPWLELNQTSPKSPAILQTVGHELIRKQGSMILNRLPVRASAHSTEFYTQQPRTVNGD
jgi:hypothetical protein